MWNRPYLIGAGMVAATLLIVWVGSARADEGTGLVCLTENGVKSVFEYGAANPQASLREAMDRTNQAQEEAQCGIVSVVFTKTKKIGTVTHANDRFDLFAVKITRICNNVACAEGEMNAFAPIPAEDASTL